MMEDGQRYLLIALCLGYSALLVTITVFYTSTFLHTRYLSIYGKLHDGNIRFGQSAIDRVLGLKVSKTKFHHFYTFGALWNLIHMAFIGGNALNILYQIHLVRRIAEQRYLFSPRKLQRESVMSVGYYLAGLFFYTITPMALALQRLKHGWIAALGISVFLYSNVMQNKYHRIFAKMYRTGIYVKPPSIGLFRYVACPHYFCEILLYSSLLVVSDQTLLVIPLYLLVLWTFLSLSFMATDSYKWYKKHFTVDKDWKKIIPFAL